MKYKKVQQMRRYFKKKQIRHLASALFFSFTILAKNGTRDFQYEFFFPII